MLQKQKFASAPGAPSLWVHADYRPCSTRHGSPKPLCCSRGGTDALHRPSLLCPGAPRPEALAEASYPTIATTRAATTPSQLPIRPSVPWTACAAAGRKETAAMTRAAASRQQQGSTTRSALWIQTSAAWPSGGPALATPTVVTFRTRPSPPKRSALKAPAAATVLEHSAQAMPTAAAAPASRPNAPLDCNELGDLSNLTIGLKASLPPPALLLPHAKPPIARLPSESRPATTHFASRTPAQHFQYHPSPIQPSSAPRTCSLTPAPCHPRSASQAQLLEPRLFVARAGLQAFKGTSQL